MRTIAKLGAVFTSVLIAVGGVASADRGKVTPPKEDHGDRNIKTGVQGVCLLQLVPGQPDTKPPEPTGHQGATVRVLAAKGDRVLAEGKTNASGRFRIAVQPGEYRLQVVPRGLTPEAPTLTPITVQKGKLTEVKIILRLLGA
jgi:hypothetical protein